MYRYVALLRGINVGGKNLIRMDALKASLSAVKFHDVVTYLQSGNIIFSHDSPDGDELATRISGVIEKDFGLQIPVIVLTMEILREILHESPFCGLGEYNPANGYVIFLSAPPGNWDAMKIGHKQMDETVIVTPRAVHLFCPGGYGNTKLDSNYFEKILKVNATARNLKTVSALVNM